MSKICLKKELRFAIPFSLFLLGLLLISVSLVLILRPYWGLSRIFLSGDGGSASVSSHPIKLFSGTSADTAEHSIVYSPYGAVMGALTIESAKIVNMPVLHGDGNDQLRSGIGQFAGGYYPGEGGKVVLDAHRETYFHSLGSAKIGDEVDFSTVYGRYVYKINDIRIVKDTDTGVIQPDDSHEYLVMYTCYPFNTPGYHPQRYVVSASLVSGTKVSVPKE